MPQGKRAENGGVKVRFKTKIILSFGQCRRKLAQ